MKTWQCFCQAGTCAHRLGPCAGKQRLGVLLGEGVLDWLGSVNVTTLTHPDVNQPTRPCCHRFPCQNTKQLSSNRTLPFSAFLLHSLQLESRGSISRAARVWTHECQGKHADSPGQAWSSATADSLTRDVALGLQPGVGYPLALRHPHRFHNAPILQCAAEYPAKPTVIFYDVCMLQAPCTSDEFSLLLVEWNLQLA